ncbi:hypothetical protein F4781DRAFT_443903 [Annulohypoxylon bovei var. microspora]|nr:hypothetical protein F4781DRAFT_443903 [Annulohypoxylon bovei var. microspora]
MARVVIGIHFGVSNTKVSWLTCDNTGIKRPLDWISQWPCAKTGFTNRTRSMVPSRIYYDSTGDVTWGYSTPEDAQSIQCLPLLLLNRLHVPPDRGYCSNFDIAFRQCDEQGKNPQDVVLDYLGRLYYHVTGQIEKRLTAAVFSKTPIHVVFTSPGGWNTETTIMLRQTVENSLIKHNRPSGKITISVIPELGAIALATFRGPSCLASIDVGDVFTVLSVDAGTTNIITYGVDASIPGFAFKALSDRTEFSGPLILRDRFKDQVRDKIGDKRWNAMSSGAIDELMASWDMHMKVSEPSSPQAAWIVRVETGRRATNITFDQTELRDIHNSIVPVINSLVAAHVITTSQATNTSPKFLVLAGEIFKNDYIVSSIKNTWNSMNECAGSTVLNASDAPSNPWLVISRSAALSGMIQCQLGNVAVVCPRSQHPIYSYPQ